MTLASTGEIVGPLTEAEARALTNRVKLAVGEVWSLLLEAHERRAWSALGYERWEDYVRTEFDMSRGRSYQVLDQARVIREIEQIVGVSTSVDISEAEVRAVKPRLASVTDAIKDRIAAEAVAAAPKRVQQIVDEVIADERAKVAQQREDAAALGKLREDAEAAGMDMDPDRLRQRGEFSRLCRDLANLPAPVEFIAGQDKHLTERHVGDAEAAYAWLDEFLLDIREGS